MDRHTISLIGVVDTLTHVLKNDETAKQTKGMRVACKRLESIRKELLTEGLRYAKIVGAARDSIFDVSVQLQGHVTEDRGMQWIINGLQSVNIQDVEPPPPPSSSSNGPKSVAPEVLQLAETLVAMSAARSKSTIAGAESMTIKRQIIPAKKSSNGQTTKV